MPESPAWWEIFSVTEEDIQAVCKMILKLYTRPKPDQERLEGIIEKLKKEHTRSRSSIMKQLSKSTNESQQQSNNHHHHGKKIKVEHIIQSTRKGNFIFLK